MKESQNTAEVVTVLLQKKILFDIAEDISMYA